MPLPAGMPERRQDCIDHEERIDEIAAEIKKHSGWWKVIGAGIVIGIGYLATFGSTINNKLDLIQSKLSAYEVGVAQIDGRLKAVESDVLEIKERHKFIDQKGRAK